jgi:hypothetical protein
VLILYRQNTGGCSHEARRMRQITELKRSNACLLFGIYIKAGETYYSKKNCLVNL